MIHLEPEGQSALTRCCNKSPFELPRTDRMTGDPSLVTCGAAPDGVKDQNTREVMQKIGHLVNEELPDGWGFFVMAFPFENNQGRMNYVSNGRREDIHNLMIEFLKKSGAQFKHL